MATLAERRKWRRDADEMVAAARAAAAALPEGSPERIKAENRLYSFMHGANEVYANTPSVDVAANAGTEELLARAKRDFGTAPLRPTAGGAPLRPTAGTAPLRPTALPAASPVDELYASHGLTRPAPLAPGTAIVPMRPGETPRLMTQAELAAATAGADERLGTTNVSRFGEARTWQQQQNEALREMERAMPYRTGKAIVPEWDPQRKNNYLRQSIRYIDARLPGSASLMQYGMKHGVVYPDWYMALLQSGQLPKSPEEIAEAREQRRTANALVAERLKHNQTQLWARQEAQERIAGYGKFEAEGITEDDPIYKRLMSYAKAGLENPGWAPQALVEIEKLLALHRHRFDRIETAKSQAETTELIARRREEGKAARDEADKQRQNRIKIVEDKRKRLDDKIGRLRKSLTDTTPADESKRIKDEIAGLEGEAQALTDEYYELLKGGNAAPRVPEPATQPASQPATQPAAEAGAQPPFIPGRNPPDRIKIIEDKCRRLDDKIGRLWKSLSDTTPADERKRIKDEVASLERELDALNAQHYELLGGGNAAPRVPEPATQPATRPATRPATQPAAEAAAQPPFIPGRNPPAKRTYDSDGQPTPEWAKWSDDTVKAIAGQMQAASGRDAALAILDLHPELLDSEPGAGDGWLTKDAQETFLRFLITSRYLVPANAK